MPLCAGKKIETYIDYQLERGEKIAPALVEAIEKSKLSVIIFSKNYASSTWRLDELAHILRCKESKGQVVIPIFYDIDPSDVRKQQGTYADAFAQLEQRFKDSLDKVHKWRDALREAAKISGFDNSNKAGQESDLVQKVVKDILTKLNREASSDLKGLVGIESRIEEIESLLCIDSLDVCSVGIWGMGGIGKTALADAIFHRLSSKFEVACFVANVRMKSEEKDGLIHLRNKLLRKILDDKNLDIETPSIGSTFLRERLSRTKVLIVLDDVNDSIQIEVLAGYHARYGPGSRIIITTRDRSLLKKIVEDDKIYRVNALKREEALHLFHLNTFKSNTPRTDYTELAEKVVDYAGGNPLALKILGSSFVCCESKEACLDELITFKKFLSKNIQKVLKLSYDGLEENEKEIFLVIACFGKLENMYILKRMSEASGSRAMGIRVLSNKSLISISDSMLIEMHVLQQEMGREIVCEQCIEEPGKRSRLFTAKDVYHVLKNNTGTAAVQAIYFNMSEIGPINRAHFEKMYNLRLLIVDNSSFDNDWENLSVSLPNSLSYLCWVKYPLKSLPSKFSPENLVEFRMSYSNLEFWSEGKKLGNLKVMDLSYSIHLTEVPDLSQSPKIEHINLMGCTSLVEIPSYFQYLDKLTDLNLGHCSNLKYLPEMPGNIEFLDLRRTAIEELPSSVWSNEKISSLHIQWCENLKNLPRGSCELKLQDLSLWGCSSLGKFWELPRNMTELELTETAIEELPSSIEHLSCLKKIDLESCKRLIHLPTSICKLNSLERLNLTSCSKFEYFPEILEQMEHLNFLCLSKTMIKELPLSIKNLIGLQTLQLYQCRNLKSGPTSIYNLNSLQTLTFGACLKLKMLPPFLVGLRSLEELNLSYCGILEIPDRLVCLTSLRDLDLSGTMIRSIPASIKQASQLSVLRLSNCERLQSLPELPGVLIREGQGRSPQNAALTLRSALTQLYHDEYEFSQCHHEQLGFCKCRGVCDAFVASGSKIVGSYTRHKWNKFLMHSKGKARSCFIHLFTR